ncbi:MAG: zinc ribbon domain-containing protein [Chloroflexi bacterium]|nr:zinc ribbon domain-containing protein [Chloroflexota bacterium]
MRKLFLIILIGALFVLPTMASAQGSVTLSSVNVQLWPEYDQPSMLVLIDIELPATTLLPVKLTFHIPSDANLVAVATSASDGTLLNALFEGPTPADGAQAFTVTMDSAKAHFEYYQPLKINGKNRNYSYLWNGDYAVKAFGIRVLEPVDTTSLSTAPLLGAAVEGDGVKYYPSHAIELASGEQFTLDLQYVKTSSALVQPEGVQPSAPVDENTPGRISLNNSLPWIIGGIGAVLVVVGLAYYWQSTRSSSKKIRRRVRVSKESVEDSEATYCPQCGTRAKSNDRFCRVCGGRIRHQEE